MKKTTILFIVFIFTITISVTLFLSITFLRNANKDDVNSSVNTDDVVIPVEDNTQSDTSINTEESVTMDNRISDEYITDESIYDKHADYISSFNISKDTFNSIVWEHDTSTNMYTYVLYTKDSSFIINYNASTDELLIRPGF